MTTFDFEQYCDRCVHAHLDPARGIVCGLTDEKPDLTLGCDDLVIDVEREQAVLLQQRHRERFQEVRDIDDAMGGNNPTAHRARARTGWRGLLLGLMAAIPVLIALAINRCGT